MAATEPAVVDTTASSTTKSRRDFRVVSESLVEETMDNLGVIAAKLRSSDGGFRDAFDVVQFLLGFWITKSGLKKILKDHPELLTAKVPELSKRAAYFLEGGATPGEVGGAIMRLPELLLLPLEKFESIMAYLEDAGVPAERVPRVLLSNPQVLLLETVRGPDKLIGSLADLVPAHVGVESIIERRPMLLELSDSDVATCVNTLLHYGLSKATISNMIIIKPGVLLLPPSVLRERLENLKKIISGRRMPNVFKVAPALLTIVPQKINHQYSVIQKYLGEEVAERVVNAFPQALSLRWEKVLLPKLEYLGELGLDAKEVVNFPAYLGYSLEDRIRPRCRLLLDAGFAIAPHAEVVSREGEVRLRRFGRPHKENLQLFGEHQVAIQHIVGLRDDDFEAQFGVLLGRVPSKRAEAVQGEDELDESDLDYLDELADLDDLASLARQLEQEQVQ